jgi:hypothetical protein
MFGVSGVTTQPLALKSRAAKRPRQLYLSILATPALLTTTSASDMRCWYLKQTLVQVSCLQALFLCVLCFDTATVHSDRLLPLYEVDDSI